MATFREYSISVDQITSPDGRIVLSIYPDDIFSAEDNRQHEQMIEERETRNTDRNTQDQEKQATIKRNRERANNIRAGRHAEVKQEIIDRHERENREAEATGEAPEVRDARTRAQRKELEELQARYDATGRKIEYRRERVDRELEAERARVLKGWAKEDRREDVWEGTAVRLGCGEALYDLHGELSERGLDVAPFPEQEGRAGRAEEWLASRGFDVAKVPFGGKIMDAIEGQLILVVGNPLTPEQLDGIIDHIDSGRDFRLTSFDGRPVLMLDQPRGRVTSICLTGEDRIIGQVHQLMDRYGQAWGGRPASFDDYADRAEWLGQDGSPPSGPDADYRDVVRVVSAQLFREGLVAGDEMTPNPQAFDGAVPRGGKGRTTHCAHGLDVETGPGFMNITLADGSPHNLDDVSTHLAAPRNGDRVEVRGNSGVLNGTVHRLTSMPNGINARDARILSKDIVQRGGL